MALLAISLFILISTGQLTCSAVGFAGVALDVIFIFVYLFLLGPVYLNTVSIIECSAEGVATVVALVCFHTRPIPKQFCFSFQRRDIGSLPNSHVINSRMFNAESRKHRYSGRPYAGWAAILHSREYDCCI